MRFRKEGFTMSSKDTAASALMLDETVLVTVNGKGGTEVIIFLHFELNL